MCLIMIYLQAVFDSFEVIVRASGLFASVEHTLHKFLFGHFKTDYSVQVGSAFEQQFFKSLSLGDGAGEAIEHDTFFIGGFFFQHIVVLCHDVYGRGALRL